MQLASLLLGVFPVIVVILSLVVDYYARQIENRVNDIKMATGTTFNHARASLFNMSGSNTLLDPFGTADSLLRDSNTLFDSGVGGWLKELEGEVWTMESTYIEGHPPVHRIKLRLESKKNASAVFSSLISESFIRNLYPALFTSSQLTINNPRESPLLSFDWIQGSLGLRYITSSTIWPFLDRSFAVFNVVHPGSHTFVSKSIALSPLDEHILLPPKTLFKATAKAELSMTLRVITASNESGKNSAPGLLADMSSSSYEALPALSDQVFVDTIGSITMTVQKDEVVKIEVTPVTRRKLSTVAVDPVRETGVEGMKHANHLRTSYTIDVRVVYTIEMQRSRGYSYKQMAKMLRDAADWHDQYGTSSFTYTLRAVALRLVVPGYQSASVVGLKLEDASVNPDPENSDEKDVLSMPAIVGIAIGGFCFLCCVVCYFTRGAALFALYRCLCPCRASVEPQASAPPQEEAKDINSYFYTEVRKRNPLPSDHNNSGSLVNDNATSMVLGSGAITNHPNSSYSLLGGTTATAPDSQDPSLYSNGGDITKPVTLPVAAQAVVGTDVAVAEVYVGEN